MVLKQHLQSCPDTRLQRIGVVSPPGAEAFKEEWIPWFEESRRIFFGFDPDDAGMRAMAKYKDWFGSRGRILELPRELPKCDWTEYLLPVPADADAAWHAKHPHAGHDYRDVLHLMANASGRRLFSMSEAGASWRAYKSENPTGLQLGFSQIDAAIAPGLLPGQVMIVLAKTGTGKTVMLCNLAYYMAHKRVMFVSLEMTKEEVYDRLAKIYRFWFPLATDTDIESAMDRVMICDENRLSERDMETLVEEYQIEKGEKPEVCFIDYLGYFARGAKGNSPYEKVSNAVMTLKAMAKAHKIAIISPAQVNRGTTAGKPIDLDDARDAGTIEETADFLFSIWRPDDALQVDGAAQPTGKLRMTILKSRHGNAGLTFSLQMDMLTLAIVDDATPYAKKANDHNFLYWRGKSYGDLRAIELAPKQMTLGGSNV
jgi:archaellum biogenesis ATPase FlaH